MKLNKTLYSLTLGILLLATPIMPVGGGIFLYRYNAAKEIEFLFAHDPGQSHQTRLGFEYPGGNIGPDKNNADGNDIDGRLSDGSFDYENPYTFLKGSIRELLEELVFIPAVLLQENNLFKPSKPNRYEHPHTLNKVNHIYEKEAVSFIAQYIKQSGLFFIYKQNVTTKNPPIPHHKMAVFFLNITNICPNNLNLPAKIVASRKELKDKGLNLRKVDAEPIAFAWITGTEIKKALTSGNPWVTPSQFAYDAGSDLRHVHQNGKILLSQACIGMMRNRETDPFNPQPNIFVATIEGVTTDRLIIKEQGIDSIQKEFNKNDPEFQQQQKLSSSMEAIIDELQKNPDLLIAKPKVVKQKLPNISELQAKELAMQALELTTLLK